MEAEVQEEAGVTAGAAVNESPKEPEQNTAEASGIPSLESPPPSERKTSTEDPAAIIESLRARLLSERNSSKSARQQAHHLSRKVKELEKELTAEVERRKQCESLIQELITKLEKAGVKVDAPDNEEEEEQRSSWKVKPSWIRRSSSDSLEGDAANNKSTNNGEQESTSPVSLPGSPVSDTSLVSRRVGRSCRTVRRKDWEVEIDEQVKGNWSRVGADIVEISKLKDSEAVGSESGWLSRMVEMFESKESESEQHQHEHGESSVDTEVGSSNNNVESVDNSYESTGPHSDASTSIPENRNEQANVITSQQNNNETTTCVCASESCSAADDDGSSGAVAGTETGRDHELPDNREADQLSRPKDDVRDILRALRLAKQRLRSSVGSNNSSPAHRNFPDFRGRYESGESKGLVTRPLAQFIPASQEFRIQRSRSHHSYVDARLSLANLSSPGRF